VIETDNGSVAVIDVAARRLERRVEGLDSPQGVAYLESLDRLVVTTHGDGTIRAYDASTLQAVGAVKLGTHADNIRFDAASGRIYAGYGEGAIAVLDALAFKWLAMVPLGGHPESFAISTQEPRMYVNVPAAGQIAIIDPVAKRQIGSWPTGDLHSNYPLALDEEHGALLVVYRDPAKVVRYRTATGQVASIVDTCKDADDVFIDAKRSLLYVICGSGAIDILHHDTLKRLGRFSTVPGARTGMFVPGADRLFVAARATGANAAEIWALQPRE
jgi:DNA-binding beta-propeller fold protein YncE